MLEVAILVHVELKEEVACKPQLLLVVVMQGIVPHAQLGHTNVNLLQRACFAGERMKKKDNQCIKLENSFSKSNNTRSSL